jgi:hypothetical protein
MKNMLSRCIYKICSTAIIAIIFCACSIMSTAGATEKNVNVRDLIGIWIQKVTWTGITESHHYQLISTGGNSIKIQYVKSTISDPGSSSEALLREINATVSAAGELTGTATYYLDRIYQLGPPKTSEIYGSVSTDNRRITLQGKTPGFSGRPGQFRWDGTFKDTVTVLERY